MNLEDKNYTCIQKMYVVFYSQGQYPHSLPAPRWSPQGRKFYSKTELQGSGFQTEREEG